jgi:hypothetical protein
MQTIGTYACYINGTHSFNVSAVSYRQAVKRAKAKTKGPVDVIGLLSTLQRV